MANEGAFNSVLLQLLAWDTPRVFFSRHFPVELVSATFAAEDGSMNDLMQAQDLENYRGQQLAARNAGYPARFRGLPVIPLPAPQPPAQEFASVSFVSRLPAGLAAILTATLTDGVGAEDEDLWIPQWQAAAESMFEAFIRNSVVISPTEEERASATTRKTAAEAGENAKEPCTICLAAMAGADPVLQINACQHVFHIDCLMEWFRKGGATCPLCRLDIRERAGGVTVAT